MNSEFSAETVALTVLAHLERRRHAIIVVPGAKPAAPVAVSSESVSPAPDDRVKAEIEVALEPVRAAYREAELPREYMDALTTEIFQSVPDRWRAAAERFSSLEARDFNLWRGGDPIARLTYVFLAMLIGGLMIWAPFIPIWDKWFPFVLAGGAWWLPTVQVAAQKRRYARALGAIAQDVAAAQPRLDEHVSLNSLLLPPGESK